MKSLKIALATSLLTAFAATSASAYVWKFGTETVEAEFAALQKPLPSWAKGFPNKGMPRLKLAYEEKGNVYKVDLSTIFVYDQEDKIYGADVVQLTTTSEGKESKRTHSRYFVTCDHRPMYDEVMYEIYDAEGNQLSTSYVTEFRKTRLTMYAPAFNKPAEGIKKAVCGRSSGSKP